MSLTFDPRLFANAPILLWPWIWLQLVCLHRWGQAQGRSVLYSITAQGRVRVHYTSDVTTELYAALIQRPPAYRTQADDPSGEAHLSAIHYWMGRLMQRGELIQFISRRTGHTPPPALRDSS